MPRRFWSLLVAIAACVFPIAAWAGSLSTLPPAARTPAVQVAARTSASRTPLDRVEKAVTRDGKEYGQSYGAKAPTSTRRSPERSDAARVSLEKNMTSGAVLRDDRGRFLSPGPDRRKDGGQSKGAKEQADPVKRSWLALRRDGLRARAAALRVKAVEQKYRLVISGAMGGVDAGRAADALVNHDDAGAALNGMGAVQSVAMGEIVHRLSKQEQASSAGKGSWLQARIQAHRYRVVGAGFAAANLAAAAATVYVAKDPHTALNFLAKAGEALASGEVAQRTEARLQAAATKKAASDAPASGN
jgi:hypothetical protein